MESQKPEQSPGPDQPPDNPVEGGMDFQLPPLAEEVAGAADAVEKPTARPKKAPAKRKKAAAKSKRPRKVATPVVKQPITSAAIVVGAVDLKDRAVAVASREANDFIGKWADRLTSGLNDFFDRLEGKKK